MSGRILRATLVVELDNFADNSDEMLLAQSVASWVASIQHFVENGGVCDLECVVVSETDISESDFTRFLAPLSRGLPRVFPVAHAFPGSTYYEKKMCGAL